MLGHGPPGGLPSAVHQGLPYPLRLLVKVLRDVRKQVGGLHTTDSEGEDVGLPGKSASDFLDAYPDLNLDVAEISDRGWWHKVRARLCMCLCWALCVSLWARVVVESVGVVQPTTATSVRYS